jgi:hypothetical protein
MGERTNMRADWVTYFLLTTATSLSLPRLLPVFDDGKSQTAIRLFLSAVAAFNVVAAIIISFENLGILGSAVIVGYSLFLFPILPSGLLSNPTVLLAAAGCIFAAIFRA